MKTAKLPKALSTIRREMRRLWAMTTDCTLDDRTRDEAYQVYHGFRWVMDHYQERPSTTLRRVDRVRKVRHQLEEA